MKNPRIEAFSGSDPSQQFLGPGIRLTGYKNIYEFFCSTEAHREAWMRKFSQVSVGLNITEKYDFVKLLGRGNFARVHLGIRKGTEDKYAVKAIEKRKIFENQRNLVSLGREIDALRRINHPNVIKLYEVYESDIYIYLVLEYLSGGEVFQKLQNKGVYSEKDACAAATCLLRALAYCHKKNVAHRDLKPENLIIVYQSLLPLL